MGRQRGRVPSFLFRVDLIREDTLLHFYTDIVYSGEQSLIFSSQLNFSNSNCNCFRLFLKLNLLLDVPANCKSQKLSCTLLRVLFCHVFSYSRPLRASLCLVSSNCEFCFVVAQNFVDFYLSRLFFAVASKTRAVSARLIN